MTDVEPAQLDATTWSAAAWVRQWLIEKSVRLGGRSPLDALEGANGADHLEEAISTLTRGMFLRLGARSQPPWAVGGAHQNVHPPVSHGMLRIGWPRPSSAPSALASRLTPRTNRLGGHA